MKNEEGLTLRSNTSVRRKLKIEPLSFKKKFVNALNSVKILYCILKKENISITEKIKNKLLKLYSFIMTLFLIASLYYFYINWHFLPYMDSSKVGFTLDFTNEENFNDAIFLYCFIKFLIFHYLFIMLLISLIRTIYSDPGYIGKEYQDLYSIPRFIRYLVTYFLNYKNNRENIEKSDNKEQNVEYIEKSKYDSDFQRYNNLYNNYDEMEKQNKFNFGFDEKSENDILDDLDIILKFENFINDKILDFSNSIAFSRLNSIDITKKNLQSVLDDVISNMNEKDKREIKEGDKYTQSFCEDILDYFEQEYENLIKHSEFHENLNNLKFFEADTKYKSMRFCSFCVTKKPDRSHHCRKCKKCIRKMDHHCLYLYTCIGYGNYKFFILTLFYSCAVLIFMVITLSGSVKFYIYEYGNLYLACFLSIFLTMSVVSIILIYFFYLHLKLLLYNVTTIDHVEKQEKNVENLDNNFYNRGKYNNICEVMGGFCTWFFPIYPSISYQNGYSFEINQEIYGKIINEKQKKKQEFRSALNNGTLSSMRF